MLAGYLFITATVSLSIGNHSGALCEAWQDVFIQIKLTGKAAQTKRQYSMQTCSLYTVKCNLIFKVNLSNLAPSSLLTISLLIETIIILKAHT